MTLLQGLLTHVVADVRTPIADGKCLHNIIAAGSCPLAPRSHVSQSATRAREDAPRGYLTVWYSLPQDNDRARKTIFNRVREGRKPLALSTPLLLHVGHE